MRSEPAERWNHNIHYHRLILDSVPFGASTALDVGTGNGLLAADLHRHVSQVVAIDPDFAVLQTAREEDAGVTWIQGDFMTHPLEPASFDVVATVATLHHLPDLDRSLARLAELTAPGGVVAVIGLARSSGPRDLVYDGVGALGHALLARRRALWEHSAPVMWPPPHTYAEVRHSAKRMLPGAIYRRLALWRYSLIWRRPTE